MSAADRRRIIKAAYGVLLWLRTSLGPEHKLADDEEESVVMEALKQHGDHLAVHRIEQKSLDAFKMVCWFTGSMLDKNKGDAAKCEAIIDASLKTLAHLMAFESDYFLQVPESTRSLLKSLLTQEQNGNPNHGIWMNGLYMAFHTSMASWRHGKATRTPPM